MRSRLLLTTRVSVPWSLYQKARPRRRPTFLPTPSTVEERYRQLATSELRQLELLFLTLTATSPFIGAFLLRYSTAAVIGPDAVSWFSTGLFVLATGMRPWSHIVDRLSQRTVDLHDVIHYPSSDSTANDMRTQMEDMYKRVGALEKTLAKTKAKVGHELDDMYDHLEEGIGAVGRTIKRHEKKFEKQEEKTKEIEENVHLLQDKAKTKEKERHAAHGGLLVDTGVAPAARSILSQILPEWLLSPPHKNLYSAFYSPTTAPSTSKMSLRSLPSSPSTKLDPIQEEEAVAAVLGVPTSLASGIVYRLGYVATMPLRAVIRMVLRSY